MFFWLGLFQARVVANIYIQGLVIGMFCTLGASLVSITIGYAVTSHVNPIYGTIIKGFGHYCTIIGRSGTEILGFKGVTGVWLLDI